VNADRLSNVIAFDDEPFPPEHRGDVRVVGAVYARLRLDGVLIGKVRRDGANAASRLAGMVSDSRFADHVQAVLLQGITLAGFNVVDVQDLHRRLGVPVVAVARSEPDYAAIRGALLTRVRGGRRKWALIEPLVPMEPWGSIFVQHVGLSLQEAGALVERLTCHGHIPEPLRAAHLIAGALGRGESRGGV
jgi:endonuclease V-like protein UPF0215 family